MTTNHGTGGDADHRLRGGKLCTIPLHQATHWAGGVISKAVGISLRSVQRIWEAHQLQPHRIRTFKRLRDPSFAAKLGLCVISARCRLIS